MNTYIQIENGKPVGFLILEENLLQAFPNVDLNNLPENIKKAEKTPTPEVGVYEIYEGVEVQLVDGVYKEVHKVRGMTSDEIRQKQEKYKEQWLANNPFNSWTFNEEFCLFTPPVPLPDRINPYKWNEQTLSWDLLNEQFN